VTASELDADLAGIRRILVDTSILIAYHTPEEQVHPLAKHLMHRIEDGGDRLNAYFSVVTACELLIRPIRAGIAEFSFMRTFLAEFPNLASVTMDLNVAESAATLRATTGIRLPDAIVIATGLLSGCEAIISNDGQWKQRMEPLFQDVRWIYLGDYL